MSDGHSQHKPESPVAFVRRVLRGMWRDLKSVYYANTLVWRVLKSGALLFLGFFCWVGGNLTLSFVDWTPIRYVTAYGFALLFWGPVTHLVVVPLVVRLRRTAGSSVTRFFARHGSKANLTVFVLVVVVLGTLSPAVMLFQFQVAGSATPDITGDLQCTKTSEEVHCHLVNPQGVDRVVVLSGGETLAVDEDPPYDFDIDRADLETVDDSQQFVVELQDDDGNTQRRFVRQVELIPGE